jgi:hypothetical protein
MKSEQGSTLANSAPKIRRETEVLLEIAILEYQQAIKNESSLKVDDSYRKICKLYPALNFVHVWMKRYFHLYDTQEDFIQDYLRVFCASLASWKPKHLRRKSKYNGSGDFKNYFWSSLQNNYINMVKAENSGKRSISSKCPVCDKWCSSLSMHLIQQHTDFMWSFMDELGYDINDIDTCPFCQNFRLPQKIANTNDREIITGKLKRHIMSNHSNYLFEEFKDKYPGYISSSSKPSSIYLFGEGDDEQDLSMYDIMSNQSDSNIDHGNGSGLSRIDNLYNSGLSSIQQQIVDKVFNDRNKCSVLSYDAKLYNCSEDDFKSELEDLKQKLFLCGIDDERT